MSCIRNSTATVPTMHPNPRIKRKVASCSLLINVHRLSMCMFIHAEFCMPNTRNDVEVCDVRA